MGSAAAAIPRLNVPAYNYWNEALHGVARAGYATMFPQAIGMAATWDAPLMHQVGDVISTEARAKNNEALRHNVHDIYTGLTFWSPNINIFRDPRWGRGQEMFVLLTHPPGEAQAIHHLSPLTSCSLHDAGALTGLQRATLTPPGSATEKWPCQRAGSSAG
jgi:hypothetical protein